MGVSDAIVGLDERAGRGKRVVCMDGFDLYEMLQRSLPFDRVIDGKVRRAAETGHATDLAGI